MKALYLSLLVACSPILGCTALQREQGARSAFKCLEQSIFDAFAACSTSECVKETKERYSTECEQMPDVCEQAAQTVAGAE